MIMHFDSNDELNDYAIKNVAMMFFDIYDDIRDDVIEIVNRDSMRMRFYNSRDDRETFINYDDVLFLQNVIDNIDAYFENQNDDEMIDVIDCQSTINDRIVYTRQSSRTFDVMTSFNRSFRVHVDANANVIDANALFE